MMRSYLSAVLVAGLFGLAAPASAQNQDFFVPGQQRAPAAGRPAQAGRQQPAPQPAPQPVIAPDQQEDQAPAQLSPRVQLPPLPDIPTLQRGPSPPASVLGVIGVPDIMRASTAAQQVQKTIDERRKKLNDDARKSPFPISALLAAGFLSGQVNEANASYGDLTQAMANERTKLSPEQLRAREVELREELAKVKREFRDRGNVIQQAAQFGLAQIERTLIALIQKVAESRGMNLVMHRQQVALNVNEFDITAEVADQLNKVLPSVIIPPDGVLPPEMAAQPAAPAPAQPATAPASPAAPKK